MVLEGDVLAAHLPGDLLGDRRLPEDLLADDDILNGRELLLEPERLSRGDLDLSLLVELLAGEAILLLSLGCCHILNDDSEVNQ